MRVVDSVDPVPAGDQIGAKLVPRAHRRQRKRRMQTPAVIRGDNHVILAGTDCPQPLRHPCRNAQGRTSTWVQVAATACLPANSPANPLTASDRCGGD
jgi:hypothetical protein